MKVIQALNSFFFDIEDHPETDWVSCIIFYGSIIAMLVLAVGIWCF